MKTRLIPLFCAAGIAIAGGSSHGARTPAGPGGVYFAVKEVVQAFDRGDEERAAAAFMPALALTFDAAGKTSRDAATSFTFFDIAPDGASIAAATTDGVSAFSRGLVDGDRGRPVTTLRSVRADCPSGDCSWAVFEFDRVWGKGEDRVVQELRGTALVKHADSGFRFFHWHVSAR